MKKSIALLLALALALGMIGAAAVTVRAAEYTDGEYEGVVLIENIAPEPAGAAAAKATVELWEAKLEGGKWVASGTAPFDTVTLDGKVGQKYWIRQNIFDFDGFWLDRSETSSAEWWYLVQNDRGTNITADLKLFYEAANAENVTRLYFCPKADQPGVRPPVKSARVGVVSVVEGVVSVTWGNWKTGTADKPIIVEAGNQIEYAITVYGADHWMYDIAVAPPAYSPPASNTITPPLEEWSVQLTDEIPAGLTITDTLVNPASGNRTVGVWKGPWEIKTDTDGQEVVWGMDLGALHRTVYVTTLVEPLPAGAVDPRDYVNFADACVGLGEGCFDSETNETFHRQTPVKPEPPTTTAPGTTTTLPPTTTAPGTTTTTGGGTGLPALLPLLLPIPGLISGGVVAALGAIPAIAAFLIALCKLPPKTAGAKAEPAPKTADSAAALYVVLAILAMASAAGVMTIRARRREAEVL